MWARAKGWRRRETRNVCRYSIQEPVRGIINETLVGSGLNSSSTRRIFTHIDIIHHTAPFNSTTQCELCISRDPDWQTTTVLVPLKFWAMIMRILPLRNSFMFSMDDLYRVFFYYQTIFSLLFRDREKKWGRRWCWEDSSRRHTIDRCSEKKWRWVDVKEIYSM